MSSAKIGLLRPPENLPAVLAKGRVLRCGVHSTRWGLGKAGCHCSSEMTGIIRFTLCAHTPVCRGHNRRGRDTQTSVNKARLQLEEETLFAYTEF